MPGEVLDRTGHPGIGEAADPGQTQIGDGVGVGAEGTAADSRVLCAHGHVPVRGESGREAEVRQLLAHGGVTLTCEVRICGGTIGHRCGPLDQRLAHSGDQPAFLVHADERRDAAIRVGVGERLQRGLQCGGVHAVLTFRDVLPHHDRPAEMQILDALGHLRSISPLILADEHLPGLFLEGHLLDQLSGLLAMLFRWPGQGCITCSGFFGGGLFRSGLLLSG